MRTLFLSPRQCWPATSGAKLRDFHFARALGSWSELTYLHYGEPGAPPLSTKDLPFCANVVTVPRPAAYSASKLIRGVAGALPLTVLNYQSPAMEAALERALDGAAFDVIHLDATQLAGYQAQIERRCPRSLVVYDWHNVESELLTRYAESNGSLPRRVYARLTSGRMRALEDQLLGGRAAHVVCSQREWERVLARVPGAHVAVAENGVDTGALVPKPPDRLRRRLLFVGLMAYHANADAAVWFARDVWPHLRETVGSDLTLTLVGANPGEVVLQLGAGKGVEVTGTVPDVRPFYDDAFAVVVPLRTGSGTRLKILEAMAAGVPVISTPLGAEGLTVTPGTDLLIAQKPEEWRDALETLRDPQNWTRLASAGRNLVERRYDWSTIGRHLVETYTGWLEGRSR